MKKFVAQMALVAVGIVAAFTVHAAQAPALPFQGEAAEQFLLTAKIGNVRALGEGITHPYRVELELNGVSHNGVFKSIDEHKSGVTTMPDGTSEIDFQDSWQTEIAAYIVDRIIGLGMVPATVARKVDGKAGSLQWFVDSSMTESSRVEKKLVSPDEEGWAEQVYKTRLFDELIANVDRHLNNILVTEDFQMRLIDHSRSFRIRQSLAKPALLTRFSRSLLEGIGRLEKKDLKSKVGDYLTSGQIDRLLQRRDEIVALAKKRVAEKGEAAVLYK